jgi:glycosyltransferase involved in cell wall biosynthesis
LATLLSINNHYYRRGGADVVFLEQNRLLEEAGWRVAPFAMHHPDNMPTPWSDYFVDEIEFGKRYSVHQKLVRIPRVVYSLEARRKLGRLLDAVQPDVAHAHNLYHRISPSVLGLLKKCGIPTVLTLHDLKLACPSHSMYRDGAVCERCTQGAVYNAVLHRCLKDSLPLSGLVTVESAVHRLLGCYRRNVDRFVVPSRFYLQKFAEWGWDPAKFVHIPNFVDVERFEPDFSVGKAFIYFGRLVPEKGLSTLIRASVQAQVPLWLAGTAPEERQVRKLAQGLGADVRFLGYQTGAVLHELVRSARATVLPSEWYENAPLSVMESYALGTPVIGAAIGGIPELIREQETGVTFRSGDVESLAAALRSVADMPDARLGEMARRGRTWMACEFTPAKYRERLLGLYGELGIQSDSRGPKSTDGTAATGQDLVSIIIPSRNRPALVRAAVRSALDQTHSNVEVIVVDDGSNPPLRLDIEDSRLRLVRNDKTLGGAAARNVGFAVARGDFLCLLDDDDHYYPNKVASQLEYLKGHPDTDMVFSQLCRDTKDGSTTIAPPADYWFDVMTNFRWPNKMHNNSTLFRRRVLDRVQFDPRLTKYQDWQFNMAISLQFKVDYLPVCVGVWHRDARADRLALQDDAAKYRNFKLICEIFASVIETDAELRHKYYRRLGYLALRAHRWQGAKSAFSRLDSWRRWPSFAGAVLRSGGTSILENAKRLSSASQGASHA